MRLFPSFRKDPNEAPARALYRAAVEQARQPVFFVECEVPDTLDGRFETIALHVFLLLRRLGSEDGRKAEAQGLAQALFDTMFLDMDENLREIGVGDLSVGKKVKEMARALYGRIAAYEDGLAGDDAQLEDAVRRNLYGTVEPGGAAVRAVAVYLRRAEAAITAQPLAALLAGEARFGSPPGPVVQR
ncbi:MAG: ubiquinol-cytochrome C chaperone family protein [Alphaproteobacteria bacterium]